MNVRFAGLVVLAALALRPACAFAYDLSVLTVVAAERGMDRFNGAPELNLRLDDWSAENLERMTAKHIGEKFDIVIGDRLVMQPRLQAPISGGELTIIGLTEDQIDALIPPLLDGQVPVMVRTVDP
jgi:preprotein translocase subunit SecD